MSLRYHHLDVFSSRPFSGNSVAVFPDAAGLSAQQMTRITQEMRHFESIFLEPTNDPYAYRARVFDLIGELDFAGHPILGAAAALHWQSEVNGEATWSFGLNAKSVTVTTTISATGLNAVLDQGAPQFVAAVDPMRRDEVRRALNLSPEMLSGRFEMEVVSTGLRYLIVPVARGLEQAKIIDQDFETLLESLGAQFAYVLDVEAIEGRHWNNDGVLEDVATGSAAGCVGAYLAKHGRVPFNQTFFLAQGRFTGRASEMSIIVSGSQEKVESVKVGGPVVAIGSGVLNVVPESEQ